MSITLETLKKSLGKKNSKSKAIAWLADLEYEKDDLESSLLHVNACLELFHDDVMALLVRSKILFKKEDYNACIEDCKKILQKEPFCLSAQKRMGDAYDKLGETNERNKCYRRVHDMDPLDKFWNPDYDNVEEDLIQNVTFQGASMVADDDFSMPDTSDEFTFEKSVEADASAQAAETPMASDDVFSLDDSAQESVSAAMQSPFSSSSNEPEEDSSMNNMFADISTVMASSEAEDSAEMDKLEEALSTTMDELSSQIPSEQEQFPVDEEISRDDVGSAFSDMFGTEDDLEPEVQQSSPFSNLDLPTDVDSKKLNEAPSTLDKSDFDDKPQSLDTAFFSIFGDDELPEEKPQSAATVTPEEKTENAQEEAPVESEGSGLFEKSSEFSSMSFDIEENAETAEPNALDSMDDLKIESSMPEIKGLEESSDDTKLEDFQVEGNGSFFDTPAQKSSESTEEKSFSVESALDSLFGDDDASEKKEDDSLKMPEGLEKGLAEEEPASEMSLDEPALADVSLTEPASKDDSLAEETPEEKSSANDIFKDSIFENDSDDSLEKPAQDDAFKKEDVVQTNESDASVEVPDITKEVGGAFNSIFGEDDSLNEEDIVKTTPAVEASSQESTGAAIEEAVLSGNSLEEDLDKSFSNLFGAEDAPVSIPQTQQPPVAPNEKAPVSLDNLEAEVSGAFKGLFETDDDSIQEESARSNQGLDFLMSGDSDDEVSVGLIKDPSAPLNQGTAELDESLNTKTLAEIYFEQGLYNKALDIYQDLARKEPENAEIKARLDEIAKVCREKFGDTSNG